MPTEDANLARVMRALLSVGDVKLDDVMLPHLGGTQRGHRLTVILDGQHADDVNKFLHPDLDEIRTKLAGWHFAQEGLTYHEREILSLAEQLVVLLDRGGLV